MISVAFEHEGKKYAAAPDVADYADVKVQTVYNWLNKNKVQGVRRRHLRYVEIESLEKFLEPRPQEVE